MDTANCSKLHPILLATSISIHTTKRHTLGVLVVTAGAGAPWAGGFDTDVDLLGEAPLDEGRDLRPLGRKAAMLWLVPSAKMNFSRNSTFVLPFATACERDGKV